MIARGSESRTSRRVRHRSSSPSRSPSGRSPSRRELTGNVGEVNPIPLSVLDLAPITRGSTAGDALRNSLDLARHAERLGYKRHWVAEHHNMKAIASAATAVVAGYLAAGTSTIRIGAGG